MSDIHATSSAPDSVQDDSASAAAPPAAAAPNDSSMSDVGGADGAKQQPEEEKAAGTEADGAEEKDKPKIVRPPRAKATPSDSAVGVAAAAAVVSAGVSSRGRERKVTQAYAPPTQNKEHAEFIVEEGEGQPLGDIENVKRRIDSIHAVDDTLKVAFVACYPHWKGPGGNTKDVIKKNLRAFSGYVKGQTDSAEKATERLQKYQGDVLKHVCTLFDISESGPKAKQIQHIVEFCQHPKASGHAYKGGNASSSGSKRKPSSSKKADGDKPKRGMTSFMLYSQEFRQQVRDDHPELSMKEIAVKLGEMWRNLSESKKNAYKERAAADGKGSVAASGGESSEGESEEEEEKPKAKKAKKAEKKKEEEVPKLSAEWTQKFTQSVDSILQNADLSTLSLKKVRAELATIHGELIVESNTQSVNAIITARAQAKTAEK